MLEATGAEELDARVDTYDFISQVLGIGSVDTFDHLASPEAPQPAEQWATDRIAEDCVVEACAYAGWKQPSIPADQVYDRDVAWRIARVWKRRPAGNVEGVDTLAVV